jgi:hypothetical protein
VGGKCSLLPWVGIEGELIGLDDEHQRLILVEHVFPILRTVLWKPAASDAVDKCGGWRCLAALEALVSGWPDLIKVACL